MIEELKELNEKFYHLYSDLSLAKDYIDDEKDYKYARSKIAEQYRIEYELLAARCDLKTEKEAYALNYKSALLIPRERRRWIFWKKKNYPAELLEGELDTEISKEFNEREKALKEIYREREEEGAPPAEESEEDAEREKRRKKRQIKKQVQGIIEKILDWLSE